MKKSELNVHDRYEKTREVEKERTYNSTKLFWQIILVLLVFLLALVLEGIFEYFSGLI